MQCLYLYLNERLFRLMEVNHCDQMVGYFFVNIWPITSMKICPKTYKFCQSGIEILVNFKKSTKIARSILKFCQSGIEI